MTGVKGTDPAERRVIERAATKLSRERRIDQARNYRLDPDGYPARDMRCGGRAVWLLGEGGEDGLLIEGHGPGALTALDAYRRASAAEGYALVPDDLTPQQRWAVFITTCGCTDAEHDAHADEWGSCNPPCAHRGLPPCNPDDPLYGFDWRALWVEPTTRGALPVTEVPWMAGGGA